MPNECSAVVKVSGRKDSVDEFIRIMNADYDYDHYVEENMSFSHNSHFFRIFSADVMDYEQDGLFVVATLDVWCAWSIACCMFDDGYYNTIKKECEDHNVPFHGTNITECAKKLQLSIEAISEEPAMCFMEHYLVNADGEFEINDVVDMEEYYIDEYNTLAEYKAANPNDGIDIATEEEYANAKSEGCWYRKGGIPYDFELNVNPPEPTKVMCTIVDKGDGSCA